MGRIMHGVSPGAEPHITYRAQDVKWLRKKYRIGQQILLIQSQQDGSGHVHKKEKWYTVIEKSKHVLLCRDDNGFRESFKYFDLEKLVVNR